MKTVLFFLSIAILPLQILAQDLNWQEVAELPEYNQEVSGMIYHNNELYVVNDSGNSGVIWVLNPETAEMIRVFKVADTTNIDWEAMAQDDTHIYVGDIGNNSGDRTNLVIYKIAKCDLNKESVTPEIIEFSYEDQTDFNASPSNTEFDAEALSVVNGELHIFTKNWTADNSSIYTVPTEAGVYTATKIGTFDTPGMITGSTYNSENETLTLVGYNNYLQTFTLQFRNYTGSTCSSTTPNVFMIPQSMGEVLQTEAIAMVNTNKFFAATEYFETEMGGMNIVSDAKLFEGDITNHADAAVINEPNPELQTLSITVYPNPATDFIQIKMPNEQNLIRTTVFDANGMEMRVQSTDNNTLNVSALPRGVYTVLASGTQGSYTQRFIKN